MKKLFVPYEISLKLKQIGFNEPCFAFWDAYNGDTHIFYRYRTEMHWLFRCWYAIRNKKEEEFFNNQDYIEYAEGHNALLAPTYQQVVDWLFFEHGKDIGYSPNKEYMDEIIIKTLNLMSNKSK